MENLNTESTPIVYDPFVMRQFNTSFKGTKLSDISPDTLLNTINSNYKKYLLKHKSVSLVNSQWDFCKYLVFNNTFSEIKTPVMKLDLSIYPFIRTGYSARVPEELPVLSRWVELPAGFDLPTANYIVCVLYSREQLLLEYNKKSKTDDTTPFYMTEDAQYAIVAIMGTVSPEADPLVPITILRNALGMEYGGNGEKLNVDSYTKSIEFWNNHIMVGRS